MKVLLYIPLGGRSLPMPSYGISVLATALTSISLVTVIDRSIEIESDDEGYEVSLRLETVTRADARLALNEKYDYVGVQVHTGNLLQTAAFLAELKSSRIESTIVIGGPSANVVFKYFSEFKLADYFVFGEGVTGFMSIMTRRELPANVLNRGSKRLQSRAVQIPPDGNWRTPNFRQLYKRTFDLLPYLTSTGCPFNCSFCTSRRELVGFEHPEHLSNQLLSFLDEQTPRLIRFNDSTFNGHLPTFRRSMQAMIAAKRKVKWGAYIALASLRASDIQIMAQSGCAYVYIGIESNVSQARLAQQKAFSDRDAFEKISELRRYGILVLVSFIVDLPGSEGQSTSEISDYIEELKPDAVHFFPYEDRPDITELVPIATFWRALLGRTTHRALAPQSSKNFSEWVSTLEKVSMLKAQFRASGRFTSESAMVRNLIS